MFHIALYQPEIPPNTGNIIRLCSNIGCHLHLIHPLGFNINEKSLRRAGLDYHDAACITEYKSYQNFKLQHHGKRILACTTKGEIAYSDIAYAPDDVLLFGPESRGLPQDILQNSPHHHTITIPMQASSRSLNLSNAVAIIAYEAWRQMGFSLL